MPESSPPFGSIDPGSGKPEGFEIDLAKAIAGHMGAKAKVQTVTPETRIPLLKQDQVDLIMSTMSITDERKKEINFSDAYFPSGIGVMVPNNSKITKHTDILGKTNCQLKGALASEFLAKGMKEKYGDDNFKSISLRTYPECVLAIKQGRADFLGTDYGTLLGLQKQSEGVTTLPGLVGETPFGIGVAKGDDALLAEVNKALHAVFADGTWVKLHKKWIGDSLPQDWPPK